MNNFQQMTVFFCTGILFVQLLASLPPISYLIYACVFALIAFRQARWLSFFIFGSVWACAYASCIQGHQLQTDLESREILISGHVAGLPVHEPRSIRFLFDVDQVVSPVDHKTFPDRIRLSWYGKGKKLGSGEKWQFLVKLKRPHGLFNPHGFDYEKWLFQQKIGATGYIRNSVENKRLSATPWWSIGGWRESLKGYLERSLSTSQHLGVIKALVLGDRSGIDTHQWDVFRETGTSHLIAISGLHIGLISALVFGFFRWFSLRVPVLRERATKHAIVAGLSAAVLYAALAGFSVPTQRALIMLSVVFGGLYWRRHYRPSHIILVALLAVLIYDPMSPMSAGFWLSFGAVAVILYGTMTRTTKKNMLVQLLFVQWWVSIGLMPLVLYFFQQVSLVSPLANIFAVPFFSLLVVPLLLIGLLLGLVNNTAGVEALGLVNKLIDLLWRCLEMLSDTGFSSLVLPHVSLLVCVISMVGVVLLLLPKGLMPKPVACVLFVPLLFPVEDSQFKQAEFEMVLLDVGQGLSVVIHTARHTLVFDTGAKYSEKSDLASTVILPYLKGRGIKSVDELTISHGDNDHAGGVETLLSGISVKRISTSVPEILSSYNPVLCEEDVSWNWDAVDFQFLSPSQHHLFEGNDASCVLKVSSKNGSVLLPGDIEKNVERSLIQFKKDQLDADVLIAPHHGSSTSSTNEFIEAVDPNYVLFPVGYKNRFGFPKQDVVQRYKDQDIHYLDTANDGAIRVIFSAGLPVEVKSYRKSHSKFWNWKP